MQAGSTGLLSQASLNFIRGDLNAAMDSVAAALGELDISQPASGEIVALQLLLGPISDQDFTWPPGLVEDAYARSAATRVASLSIQSHQRWDSGSLFEGLLLNQSALQHANEAGPIWRFFADLLLVKKLFDLHVSHQAARVIGEMQDLIDGCGLHVFEAVPDALRGVLHLQAGRFDEAARSAAAGLRTAEQHGAVFGVKLALSVLAMAHLGLGEQEVAAAASTWFHAERTAYVTPDSVARTTFAELALVASNEGPRAAADQIRAKWDLLCAGSPCIVEDVIRPAWLVGVARSAGDPELAERSLRAIERLATKNRGVTLLADAAGQARAVFAGDQPGPTSILSCGADHPSAAGPGRLSTGAPAGPAIGPGVEPAQETVRITPGRSARFASLSRRESEIAWLVGRGMTNQQVATALGISPHTVNFHLRRVFRKLSISTRVSLGHLVAQIDQQDAMSDPGNDGDGSG